MKEQTTTIIKLTKKITLLSLLIFATIILSDHKGYFNPDNQNNHTLKKWNYFYEFSKKNNVDILLIGNSHLYTGINPKNLSSALGLNSFILASPGTRVIDHYYTLEEAIKVSTPKVIIIETYGLKSHEPYKIKKGILSDQFKSFSARKNTFLKLKSTPLLFAPKHYPYCWSNTLRNHNFIFNNKKQISENIKISKRRRKIKKDLYLGRYVRFQTGIEDSIINQYKINGSPVDGGKYEINESSSFYIQKIINICEENKIKLVFLTLPMYQEHITNYNKWKKRLQIKLGKYGSTDHWLDLQIPINYTNFTRNSFENTYKLNQHMTYSGSLLATYKLVDFINTKNLLTKNTKKKEQKWRSLFYGEEGFFENNSPVKHDKRNKIIYTSESIEILLLKKQTHNTILAKIKTQDTADLDNYAIELEAIVTSNGQQYKQNLILNYDIYHSHKKNLNYTLNIKNTITEIKIINVKYP
jgi:hypothetical protein